MEPEIESIIKKIPSYVFVVSDELIRHGFEAYLVGGSLRDLIIGRVPSDYDIATNAKPDEIERIFPKSISTNARFGTVIVLSKDKKGETFDIEVTTYRSEEDYTGGRWPSKVKFTSSIQEDLSRRDFTINALAVNLDKKDEDQQIVDLFLGLKDLRKKIIKAVGDPVERFTEDGLRAFRACRLASLLEFTIEEKTFEAIKNTLSVAEKVSMERIRDEFIKMTMGSSKPSTGLRLMKDTGLLEIFLPELLDCIGIVQPEYHADDLFDHSLKAYDLAQDSVKIAALLHDIGKSRTMTKDGEEVHFYGHDVVGAEMTRQILSRLKFSRDEIERNFRLVRWHMFYYPSADWRLEEEIINARKNPVEIEKEGKVVGNLEAQNERIMKSRRSKSFKEGWTDAAIRRFIRNAGGEEAIEDLIKLRIADAGANPKSSFHPGEIEALENRIAEVREKEMAIKITDLDINGEDLRKLGIESGPGMGEILNYLLEIVIEEPVKNKKAVLTEIVRQKYLE
ncbi:HD domain-containing protein [Candidatus Dojkabacteria bacterium]|nr:HD domain-containing protein [Candidatus Dojkabacteria bacterium]